MNELERQYAKLMGGNAEQTMDGYTVLGDQNLDGWKKWRKKLKKSLKVVPISAATRQLKKLKSLKKLKKLAPYAAVGAAAYFGGPVAAAKAKGIISKANAQRIKLRQKARNWKAQKAAEEKAHAELERETHRETKQLLNTPKYARLKAIQKDIQSDPQKYKENLPEIRALGADVMKNIAAKEGVVMQSEDSQKLADLEMADKMPPTSTGIDAKTVIGVVGTVIAGASLLKG